MMPHLKYLAAQIALALGHGAEATKFYLNSGQLPKGTEPLFIIALEDQFYAQELMREIKYMLRPHGEIDYGATSISCHDIRVIRADRTVANLRGNTAFGCVVDFRDIASSGELVDAMYNSLLTFKHLGHDCFELPL